MSIPEHAGGALRLRFGALVFVLSGPSGVGKDSVLAGLQQIENDLHYCVTATTRPPRTGEQEGVDYYFLSEAEFEQLRSSGGLLESAQVHGRSYGLPAAQVQDAVAEHHDVMACVDVQGARSIRARIPAAVLIFLAPSSLDELRQRLTDRGTEDSQQLELRLANAEGELDQIPLFDYVVINGDGELDRAVDAVRAIIRSERMRVAPRYASLNKAVGH
ncbi:MAG: guanylate kinase [Chloroflexi bacterium]|nr:guanylate kinase [Chloroflexota bacterium]